jgi:hypothetical protein
MFTKFSGREELDEGSLFIEIISTLSIGLADDVLDLFEVMSVPVLTVFADGKLLFFGRFLKVELVFHRY